MNRTDLAADDFSYNLPEEKIAKYPLANRNNSKLLSYKNGDIKQDVFFNLKKYLPKDSVIVFNDTKVLAARLFFKKLTGAKIEVFCLEPHNSTAEQALSSTNSCVWQCMVGNLKRFKEHDVLEKEIASVILKVKIIKKRKQDVLLQFNWSGGIEFSQILNEAGQIPLPPYLNRETEEQDEETYQTVYAKNEGAVAAPTAGLHFIEEQLKDLQNEGHSLAYLTLFVGAGTFRAVKTEKLVEHEMHKERIVISKATIHHLSNKQGNIVSVGTTSLRSLESLYWYAVKLKQSEVKDIVSVEQDDAYILPSNYTWKEACDYLIDYLEENKKESVDFHSGLFIMPGYQWKAISGLITNFHQPKSTLLSLVSAWIGEDWKKVYKYALEYDFRFLSYGDSSILLP